jgi:hypothetical protein
MRMPQIPWDDKVPKAMFRGADTNKYRGGVAALASRKVYKPTLDIVCNDWTNDACVAVMLFRDESNVFKCPSFLYCSTARTSLRWSTTANGGIWCIFLVEGAVV